MVVTISRKSLRMRQTEVRSGSKPLPANIPTHAQPRVGKVELGDIVAAVEWCVRVWPQGRLLVEGHERTWYRRGADS
jgi:hypothetical protein